MQRMTDDNSERKRKRDKDGDKGRVRARVVESRQVGVCWPGPSGAIDPGWPYIRDRKPELHASSPSPRSPPSLPSLLNRSPRPSSLLGSPLRTVLLSSAVIQGLSASTTSCCQFIILRPRLAAPGAKCTQPSIHNRSFIILCMCVSVCALVAFGV